MFERTGNEAHVQKVLNKIKTKSKATAKSEETIYQKAKLPYIVPELRENIDACADNQVVIEINANPYRLDMDWSHIPYAMTKGVLISINPDAHSIAEIDNIRWGVSAARKGGLTKAMTWNAMPLKKNQEWLKRK